MNLSLVPKFPTEVEGRTLFDNRGVKPELSELQKPTQEEIDAAAAALCQWRYQNDLKNRGGKS